MDYRNVNINLLTLREKAELVEDLTHKIIIEATGDNFQNVSDANKRIAGLFRTFGSQFIGSATCVNRYIKGSDDVYDRKN